MESQAQKLIETGHIVKAAFLMERRILSGGKVSYDLLQSLPPEQREASPFLMYLYSQYLLQNGQVFEASAGSRDTLRIFAEMSLQKGFLNALALMIQVYLRLGSTDDAILYLGYLQQEYERDKKAGDGIVPYTLAISSAYLTQPDPAGYLVEAFELFRQAQDVQGMAMTLLELMMTEPLHVSGLQRQLWITALEQAAAQNRTGLDYIHMVRIIDLARQDRWADVKFIFDHGELDTLPLYEQRLCYLLALRANMELPSSNQIPWKPSSQEPDSDLAFQFLNYACRYVEEKRRGDADSKYTRELLQPLYQLCRIPRHERLLEYLLTVPDQPPEKPLVHISCFGGLRISGAAGKPEQPPIHWKRRRALEILAYLLLQRNFIVPKERLLEELFPGQALKKASNQLSVALHHLNMVLMEHLGVSTPVQIHGGSLQLSREVEVRLDLEEYARLLRSGDQLWDKDSARAADSYEQAFHLYGTYMQGLPEFDWTERIREEYRLKQAELTRKLGIYYMRGGELAKAEYYYKEAISVDPANEALYEVLIAILLEAGREHEAILWENKLGAMLEAE